MIDSTNPRVMADNIRHLSGEFESQNSDISTLQGNVTAITNALEAYTIYVSDEIKIGKVGNDDLYRKIITAETLTGGSSTDVLISANFDKLINLYGRVVSTNYQIPVPYPASSSNLIITASMYQTSLRITVGSYYSDTNSISDVWISVEYTKSAPPSAALSPAPDDSRSIENEDPEIRSEEIEPEVNEEAPDDSRSIKIEDPEIRSEEIEPEVNEEALNEDPVVETKTTTRKRSTSTK